MKNTVTVTVFVPFALCVHMYCVYSIFLIVENTESKDAFKINKQKRKFLSFIHINITTILAIHSIYVFIRARVHVYKRFVGVLWYNRADENQAIAKSFLFHRFQLCKAIWLHHRFWMDGWLVDWKTRNFNEIDLMHEFVCLAKQ